MVLGPARGNCWVAMPGAVVEASPELLRYANHVEKLDAEAVQTELRAMAKEFTGGQGPQRGFMKIAADERPPGAPEQDPGAGGPSSTAPNPPGSAPAKPEEVKEPTTQGGQEGQPQQTGPAVHCETGEGLRARPALPGRF